MSEKHTATQELREAVRDAVSQALTGVYYCSRVWSAWQVGTMTEDDFIPAAECDDVLDEITDAAMTALAQATPSVAAQPQDIPLNATKVGGDTYAWQGYDAGNSVADLIKAAQPQEAGQARELSDDEIARRAAEELCPSISDSAKIERTRALREAQIIAAEERAKVAQAAPAVPDSLEIIAATRKQIIGTIRAYGDKSCADYIETWLQPERIAELIAAAAPAQP